jgi:hypothetical protein
MRYSVGKPSQVEAMAASRDRGLVPQICGSAMEIRQTNKVRNKKYLLLKKSCIPTRMPQDDVAFTSYKNIFRDLCLCADLYE